MKENTNCGDNDPGMNGKDLRVEGLKFVRPNSSQPERLLSFMQLDQDKVMCNIQ